MTDMGQSVVARPPMPSSSAPWPGGREQELAVLRRVREPQGPRVCFVYGPGGMGKSWLLDRCGEECAHSGVEVVAVDCRLTEPTEQGFLDALGLVEGTGDHGSPEGAREVDSVLLIDTYEQFRLSDPWLRHELLPRLGPRVRVVIAGREPPMLEWAVERGELGGVEVLPLGPLDDEAVAAIVAATGVADGQVAATVAGVCRGHPLSLRLALEARLAVGPLSDADALPQVVDALVVAFRDGLDAPTRTALDAAAVPLRVTHGVLEAMLEPPDAEGESQRVDATLEALAALPFVQATGEGLILHVAVQDAVVSRLRALDPDRLRRYRTSAWHHLQRASRGVGRRELARSTSDLLFLIDNPFVREAMFPTSAHLYSVEPHRRDDVPALRAMFSQHESPEEAAVLEQWLERVPQVVRAVRDRAGQLVGCSILAEWRDIPPSFEHSDPVVAGWARHAAGRPLAAGQTTLVLRRVLASETGEGPSPAQAAAWLDVKRGYLELRPRLGRVFTVLEDRTPFEDAFDVLGIRPCGMPVSVGRQSLLLSVLEMGPESVDGWLARLAAAELGIATADYLDPADRSVAVGSGRVPLTPLEFGVLTALQQRRGRAVARADLLAEVWGADGDHASNVVDVVVRGLRRKLGADATRIETARGIGYRFR
jgi:hypothetical protein